MLWSFMKCNYFADNSLLFYVPLCLYYQLCCLIGQETSDNINGWLKHAACDMHMSICAQTAACDMHMLICAQTAHTNLCKSTILCSVSNTAADWVKVCLEGDNMAVWWLHWDCFWSSLFFYICGFSCIKTFQWQITVWRIDAHHSSLLMMTTS